MVQDPAEAAGPGLQHQRAGGGWQQLCEADSKGQKKEKKQEYLGDDLSSKTRDEPLPQKLYSSAIHFQTHKVVPLPLCTKRAKGSVNKQDIFKETPALNNTSSKEKSL